MKAGGKSISPVRKLLDHKNPFIQARAIWLLGKLGKSGLQVVEELLEHENEQIRICAFRVLRHENQHILEHANKLADDPSPSVRSLLAMRYIPFKNQRTFSSKSQKDTMEWIDIM